MTDKKTNKRALLISVLAIVLCIAMLVGTTFAWFTDSASTAVNKIVSGKLDIALEMSDDGTNWKSAEGKTLSFKTADNRTTEILWEPGCTYVLPMLRIVNNGNLAIKYKVQITGINGDDKLNEVIEWTINDKAIDLTEQHIGAGEKGEAFTIKGHMLESAGNNYQDLTIDGIGITVYAAQDTVEVDSFDDQYDKNAEYDKGTTLFADSADSLKAAAAKAKAGDVITLTDDIKLSETVTFDASGITLNGNGHKIVAEMTDDEVASLKTVLRFGHDTTYCTGVTLKNLSFTGKGGRALHFHGGTSSTLDNVNISGDWSLPINFFGTHGAVMNNCSISSSYADKYVKSSIFANEQSANQIILNNTTIDSIFVNATEKGATYANGGIKLVVNSGSHIGTIHTNAGITRTFHQVNGGTVDEVLADID
mgnify:CR=1 FL=1